MESLYEHAGITIYHADCRDLVGELTADVVVTDPPYGVDGSSGTANVARGKATYVQSQWRDDSDYLQDVCVPAIVDLLERIDRGALTVGNPNLHLWLDGRCDLMILARSGSQRLAGWVHGVSQPSSRSCISVAIPGWVRGQMPSGTTLTKADRQVLESEIDHPCPKPYMAWKWLVAKASLEGETVIDPFVGSGTTLVVAKHLGRKAIGTRDRRALLRVAAERLSQEVLAL